MKTPTIFQWYQILRQHYQFSMFQAVRGGAMVDALATPSSERSCLVVGESGSNTAIEVMNKECPGMQSQSNEFRPQATERLFLAVVNQAISDVLENGKEAKEAERWLLSTDFDALDKLFACLPKRVESRLQKTNQLSA